MIGKRVIFKSVGFDFEAKGTVIEEGCFMDHYVVDMGKLHIEVCGFLENHLLAHKNQLTVLD